MQKPQVRYTQPFIDGRYCEAGAETYLSYNPATGQPIAEITACGESEHLLVVFSRFACATGIEDRSEWTWKDEKACTFDRKTMGTGVGEKRKIR